MGRLDVLKEKLGTSNPYEMQLRILAKVEALEHSMSELVKGITQCKASPTLPAPTGTPTRSEIMKAAWAKRKAKENG